MKVNASPTPSTMRAAKATGSDRATANSAWAPAITSEPVMISRFEPYRAINTLTGTWSAA